MPFAHPVSVPAICLALALGPGLSPAQADALSGTVDGTARDWHILSEGGTDGARFFQSGMFTQATIFGFPNAADTGNVRGALEVSLTLQGQPGAMVPADGELVYYAGGVRELFVPDRDGPALDITIDESRATGDALFISGTIAGRVYRMVSLATEELDHDDSHQIEARFAVTLQPE
ncbi:MAG: hypothetical protein JJU19_14105 [Pararhodobacter sp.]|nr:hypothetical protein [Pararhodobacter sp.]